MLGGSCEAPYQSEEDKHHNNVEDIQHDEPRQVDYSVFRKHDFMAHVTKPANKPFFYCRPESTAAADDDQRVRL